MANTKKKQHNEYLEALMKVRRRTGHLEAVTVKTIEAAINQYAERLEKILASAPAGEAEAIEYAIKLLERAGAELYASLESATAKGRLVSFQDTVAVWEAASAGVAEFYAAQGFALPAVPRINMLGTWESFSAPVTWRTILKGHSVNAVKECGSIIRQSMIEGAEPIELGRRLRRYVQGVDGFENLFELIPGKGGNYLKLDLRKLRGEEKDAAQRLVYNARRIAISELHNAKCEAEIQSMYHDRYVKAVKWELAPDRGNTTLPDACDVLADRDFYGLGKGIYPVHRVPAPPHPHDRCNRFPVSFTLDEIKKGTDRPTPRRILTGEMIQFPDDVTEVQANRARFSAESAIRHSERGMRKFKDIMQGELFG